jgi:hypothetical protein
VLFKEHRRPCRDVLQRVAAKDDGKVVLLEPRRVGVAREPDCVLENPNRVPPLCRRTKVAGEMLLRLCRNVLPEVRQAPGHGHPQAGRRRREALVELPQCVLEALPSVAKLGRALAHSQPRSDDLVMQRWDEHLDTVVANHGNAVEQVLLRSQGSRRGPRRRLGELVDELVDPAGCQHRSRRAADELPASEPHARRFAGRARARASCDRGGR